MKQMSKAFVAILVTLCLTGCGDQQPGQSAPVPRRFEMVSNDDFGCSWVTVLKDKETGRSYIMATTKGAGGHSQSTSIVELNTKKVETETP